MRAPVFALVALLGLTGTARAQVPKGLRAARVQVVAGPDTERISGCLDAVLAKHKINVATKKKAKSAMFQLTIALSISDSIKPNAAPNDKLSTANLRVRLENVQTKQLPASHELSLDAKSDDAKRSHETLVDVICNSELERVVLAFDDVWKKNGLSKALGALMSTTATTAATLGSLSKEHIQAVISAHSPEIKACYERGLKKVPGLKGQVDTKFIVAASGKVDSAEIVSTTLAPAAVEACITTAIRTWLFDKPKGGGIVVIRYPFEFKPG